MKILTSIFVVTVLCCGAGVARAAASSVVISEVLYDVKDLPDTDHEWVELYNSSDTAVSLQGWKFADSSNHTLNAPPANGGQGSLSIEPRGYVILSGNAATFLADHPGFVGTVIDTVMSLNNAGATLSVLSSTGQVVDSFTYTSSLGGSGDGCYSLEQYSSHRLSLLPRCLYHSKRSCRHIPSLSFHLKGRVFEVW
jgi:hypothetical protein